MVVAAEGHPVIVRTTRAGTTRTSALLGKTSVRPPQAVWSQSVTQASLTTGGDGYKTNHCGRLWKPMIRRVRGRDLRGQSAARRAFNGFSGYAAVIYYDNVIHYNINYTISSNLMISTASIATLGLLSIYWDIKSKYPGVIKNQDFQYRRKEKKKESKVDWLQKSIEKTWFVTFYDARGSVIGKTYIKQRNPALTWLSVEKTQGTEVMANDSMGYKTEGSRRHINHLQCIAIIQILRQINFDK